MEEIAKSLGSSSQVAVATPTLRQIFVTSPQETSKIDLVRDIEVQFGKHQTFGDVIVDSIENIAANKIAAIFGRTESKDFVDLHFILQQGYRFSELLTLAKQKDAGLTEFLAGMLRQVRNLERLPRMIKPVDLSEIKRFYLQLEEELLRDINPDN